MDFYDLRGEDQSDLNDCVHPRYRRSSDQEIIVSFQLTLHPPMYRGKYVSLPDHQHSIFEGNIKRRFNVDMTHSMNRSTLMFACGSRLLELVEIIIRSGANILYTSRYKHTRTYTVMEYAKNFGTPEIVNLIQNEII